MQEIYRKIELNRKQSINLLTALAEAQQYNEERRKNAVSETAKKEFSNIIQDYENLYNMILHSEFYYKDKKMVNNMKVLTKNINIMNREFVLITDTNPKYHNRTENNNTYYGLIPYEELEDGKMKRALNGFEIAIADTPAGLIDRKIKELRLEQWSKEHPGHTEKQAIEWIMENLL